MAESNDIRVKVVLASALLVFAAATVQGADRFAVDLTVRSHLEMVREDSHQALLANIARGLLNDESVVTVLYRLNVEWSTQIGEDSEKALWADVSVRLVEQDATVFAYVIATMEWPDGHRTVAGDRPYLYPESGWIVGAFDNTDAIAAQLVSLIADNILPALAFRYHRGLLPEE